MTKIFARAIAVFLVIGLIVDPVLAVALRNPFLPFLGGIEAAWKIDSNFENQAIVSRLAAAFPKEGQLGINICKGAIAVLSLWGLYHTGLLDHVGDWTVAPLGAWKLGSLFISKDSRRFGRSLSTSERVPARYLLEALGLTDPEHTPGLQVLEKRKAPHGVTVLRIQLMERKRGSVFPPGITVLQNRLVNPDVCHVKTFDLLYNRRK